MKIYVACHSKEIANEIVEELKNLGHDVVSTWHYGEFRSTCDCTNEERAKIAMRDYNQIKDCDILILISGLDKYSGGKFVEAGIAIGLDKEVVVIGHRENMLMYLDCISVFDSVDNWNRDLHFKMAERIIKGWPLWKQNAVRSYINTSLSDR